MMNNSPTTCVSPKTTTCLTWDNLTFTSCSHKYYCFFIKVRSSPLTSVPPKNYLWHDIWKVPTKPWRSVPWRAGHPWGSECPRKNYPQARGYANEKARKHNTHPYNRVYMRICGKLVHSKSASTCCAHRGTHLHPCRIPLSHEEEVLSMDGFPWVCSLERKLLGIFPTSFCIYSLRPI